VWLVLVIVTGLVLLVLVLASLLRLEVTLGNAGSRIGVRWLGLGFRFDTRAKEFNLSLFSYSFYRKRTERPRPTTKQRVRSGVPLKRWLELRGALLAQLRYLLTHSRFKHLKAELIIATPDPALTGTLYGLAAGLVQPYSALLRTASLRIAPDFTSEASHGSLDTALSLRIIHLAVVAWRLSLLSQKLRRPWL